MPISSKRRAELRAHANRLKAQVHVGLQGVTDALLESLDDVLRTHELVKVQLGRQPDLVTRDVANEVAKRLHADIVQVIGRTATFYRENPDLERKKGAPEPWER